VALACAGAALLGGCAASRPLKGDGYFAVVVPQAQVYRFSPSQPTGADAQLKQGQKVLMLRQEYGYSRVMTEDGMTGFIANDFIAPTSPPEKPRNPSAANLAWANLPPLPSRGTGIPGVSSANRAILQNDPLFGGDKLPPLPNDEPKPGFRFNVRGPSAPPADN
jgi:hypothetical protein